MTTITLSDPSLRDGNHAVGHKLSREQIVRYAALAEDAGVPIVEVGHGNGLGASSMQVGIARESDLDMLSTARSVLRRSKLGIHVIPGFATINKDLLGAVDIGVDVVRVAAHSTEADITRRHIEFVRGAGLRAIGVLMMSHMAPTTVLVEEARKMESYGAEGVVIMDSAGAYLIDDVSERIGALAATLSVEVGFHGHNNLGLAIANSLAAARAGATIIDGTIRGFGAGAGNAQLEVLVAVLDRAGYSTGIDLYRLLDASDRAVSFLVDQVPTITSTHIVSGLAGVFSGFQKHVDKAAAQYGVDTRDLLFSIGERRMVAGQEDLITEVAIKLARKPPRALDGSTRREDPSTAAPKCYSHKPPVA